MLQARPAWRQAQLGSGGIQSNRQQAQVAWEQAHLGALEALLAREQAHLDLLCA